jgi:hypothetical protein
MAVAYPKAAEAANGRAHPGALFTDTWPNLFLRALERAGGARRRLD